MLVEFLLTQTDERGREWIGGRVYNMPAVVARRFIRAGVAVQFRPRRETKPEWYEVRRG